MEQTREVLYDTLAKIATVLVDRRFWMSVFIVFASLSGIFGLSEDQVAAVRKAIGEDGEAAAVFFEKVIEVLAVLIAVVTTIVSWTKRPPSGLEFRENAQLAAYLRSKYGE